MSVSPFLFNHRASRALPLNPTNDTDEWGMHTKLKSSGGWVTINLQDLRMPYTPICEWYGNSQNFEIRSWLSMGVHIFSEIPRLTYPQTFTFPVCLLIFLTSDLMWLKWTFQLNDTPSLTPIQNENIHQILRISRCIRSAKICQRQHHFSPIIIERTKTRGTNPSSSLHPSRGDYVAIWYYEQHSKRNVGHHDLKYVTHCTSYSKVVDCM